MQYTQSTPSGPDQQPLASRHQSLVWYGFPIRDKNSLPRFVHRVHDRILHNVTLHFIPLGWRLGLIVYQSVTLTDGTMNLTWSSRI